MTVETLPDYPPMFSITGSFIPIAPHFAAALASIVIEWSRVEIGLQTDPEGIRRYPGISDLCPKMPRSFDSQLKLWRKSIRQLYATIDSYQKYAYYIYDTAAELAPKRNHLIHGQWEIAGASDQGVWTVTHFKLTSGGGYEIHRSEVTGENWGVPPPPF